jgi:tetratricopeptide (TPR) repeat protein
MHREHNATRTSWLTAVLLVVVLAMAGCLRSPEEKYAEFMKSGKQYMEKQDYSSAVLQFRNAARVMPEAAEAYYQAALADLRLGRGNEAYQLAKKAEQLDPNLKENEMLLAQLMVLISQKDPGFATQATDRLTKLKDANPNDPDVLYLLAATQARVGNSEEMENFLMEALKASPQHLQSSLALAKAKLAERDFAGAEGVLRKAVEEAPDSVPPKLALGQLYLLLKRPDDAKEQFSQALKMDAKNAQAMIGLAVVNENSKNPAEAERLMQQVSSLDDKRFQAYYGRLLMQHEKWGPAVTEFQRLVTADPGDADLRGMLLMAYLRADRAPEAETFLKRLVAENPDDRTARKQLVGLLVSLNRTSDAEAILTQAIEKNPKDADAMLQRTEIYWRTGRIQQAEQDLAQVLQTRPNSHEAHFFQAKLHQSRNQPRLYQQELREAVRLEPNFLVARLELANALRATGDAKAALTLLDEAPAANKRVLGYAVARNWALIATDSPDARKMVNATLQVSQAPEILLQDGALKLEEKQYEAARRAFQSVLDQEPDNTRALGALAQSYLLENQKARAAEVIQKHASSRPNSAEMQNFLGAWYAKTGYRTEARQAYQAALTADPKNLPARLALAQLDLAEGRYDSVRQTLREVTDVDPDNVDALVYLAMAAEGSKNYDAAINAYKKALTLDPQGPLAVISLNNLAYRLAETNNAFDEALGYAQRAKEQAPNNKQVDDTLGWIYYRKGIFATALEYLQSAAASDSGKKSAAVQYHLALCQIQSGDVATGRQTLTYAKSLDPNLPEAALADQMLQRVATQ